MLILKETRMPEYQLALLGFGNVGKALAHLLLEKQTDILNRYGISYRVTGIATSRHGTAIDPHGIDLERALALVQDDGSLETLSKLPPPENTHSFICRCQL